MNCISFFLLGSEKRIVAVQPDVSEVQVVVVTIEWFKILFKNPKKWAVNFLFAEWTS